jgi:hypothetical protein
MNGSSPRHDASGRRFLSCGYHILAHSTPLAEVNSDNFDICAVERPLAAPVRTSMPREDNDEKITLSAASATTRPRLGVVNGWQRSNSCHQAMFHALKYDMSLGSAECFIPSGFVPNPK